MLEVPEWMDRGACATEPDDLWFPERGQPAEPARTVCRACGVRDVCLTYALQHRIEFGVWGGLDHKERSALRRQARQITSSGKRPAA